MYFDLRGECRQCGECCVTPSIQTRPLFLYLHSTRRLMLWWHRVVNGFELIAEDRRTGLLIFRCTHYDSDSRRCDSYGSRPAMCRDYPRQLIHDPNPEFFPKCGFHVLAENAEEIRRALQDLDLPADKIAELERKFHAVDAAPPIESPVPIAFEPPAEEPDDDPRDFRPAA